MSQQNINNLIQKALHSSVISIKQFTLSITEVFRNIYFLPHFY